MTDIRTRSVVAALTLITLLFGASPAPAGDGSEGSAGKKGPFPGRTVEPAPPYGLEISLQNLQKNSNGGVATLLLRATSQIDLGEVTLVADLPNNLSFTDGSATKSWVVNLGAGSSLEIPAQVLTSEDGKYVVKARLSGEMSGKPVRRGTAFKLLVGVEERAQPVKNGAVEYPGVRSPARNQP